MSISGVSESTAVHDQQPEPVGRSSLAQSFSQVVATLAKQLSGIFGLVSWLSHPALLSSSSVSKHFQMMLDQMQLGKELDTGFQFDSTLIHVIEELQQVSKHTAGLTQFKQLDEIAANPDHPFAEDAKLIRQCISHSGDVMDYLAAQAEDAIRVRTMEILPRPIPMIFNSYMPNFCLKSVDFQSQGRSLLFEGARKLLGVPPNESRHEHLMNAAFSLPRHAPNGQTWGNYLFSNGMNDPLDDYQVYE